MISEKDSKELLIYSTRYVQSKSIKLASLYYDELIGKLKEYREIKYLMVDYYMLDKVSDKIKEVIATGKFEDTKMLVVTADKLPDDINFEKYVIYHTIKDNDKFHPQLFLEEALFLSKHGDNTGLKNHGRENIGLWKRIE